MKYLHAQVLTWGRVRRTKVGNSSALVALRGTACAQCGRPIEFFPRSATCRNCHELYCPVCGLPQLNGADPCEHLLAISGSDADDRGWHVSPFAGVEIPYGAADTKGLGGAQRRQLFGPLLPLLEAYEDDLSELCSEQRLFEQILLLLSVDVIVMRWEYADTPIHEGYSTDYFTADPEGVRRQIQAVIHQFAERFEDLNEASANG